jgi:hypothetical protein
VRGRARARRSQAQRESERPLIKGACNGVAVDRPIKLVFSLLLSALGFLFSLPTWLFGRGVCTRHRASITRGFRWHRFGTPEVRAALRKVGLFIQARISF